MDHQHFLFFKELQCRYAMQICNAKEQKLLHLNVISKKTHALVMVLRCKFLRK